METTFASYSQCIQGLQEWFEPVWEMDLYFAEFLAWYKYKEEDWAKDLSVITNRMVPEIAIEHLIMTLIHLLKQERWVTKVEVTSDFPKMSQGGQRLCPTQVNTATLVKL